MLRRVRDPDDNWAHAPWVNFDEWRTLWLLPMLLPNETKEPELNEHHFGFTKAELKEQAGRRARQREVDRLLPQKLDAVCRQFARQRQMAIKARRFVKRRPPVDIDQPSVLSTVVPSLACSQTPHPLAAVLSSLAESPCQNPASPAENTDSPTQETWSEPYVEPMTADCATQ